MLALINNILILSYLLVKLFKLSILHISYSLPILHIKNHIFLIFSGSYNFLKSSKVANLSISLLLLNINNLPVFPSFIISLLYLQSDTITGTPKIYESKIVPGNPLLDNKLEKPLNHTLIKLYTYYFLLVQNYLCNI